MKSNTEKKIKTAVFGGSFDPIHFGHIDIVRNLERKFDRVLVVPSAISPFKTGATEPAVRFKLCKKVFTSEKTQVLRYEIAKKGVSYSVDTAAHLAKKFAGEKLYWVIGSEELLRLPQWHDIDRLKKLVTFFVVPRPGFDIGDAIVKSLKKRKIKLVFAKFEGLDISSTRIKIDMAFGKGNSFMPSAVYKYAVEHGLFDPYGKYAAALNGMINERRIEHTYRTAVRGAQLAKKYGANVNDVVVACILHDIGKDKATDYEDKADVSGYPERCAHSPIGAYIAKKLFDVSDDIAEAIRVHSTGDGNMDLLAETVYLADKTESGRKYKSFAYMCKLCDEDKDLAMLYALREVNALEDAQPNEYGERAIARYTALCEGKTFPPEEKKKNALIALRHSRELVHVPSKEIRKTEHVGHRLPLATKTAREYIDKSGLEPAHAYNARLAEAVAAELDLHKARDIKIVDLCGKTVIADYFVIASATSSTAVKALCGYVEDVLTAKFKLDPNKRDVNAEWIALDYGGIIIHVFTERMREFYNIERLWSDGGNIIDCGE